MASSQPQVNIRSVALPAEHGGWGFLLEPILLGLLVAFSSQGVLLALSAIGVFLIHQPLKISIKDRIKKRRPPRAILAERFVLGYGLLAVVPMVILLFTTPPDFLLPIALAVSLAGVQLYYDSRNQSRKLLPEICGALALAMIAPAIVMLAGWTFASGLILWLILALRALTSILYVRERLKLERGKPISHRMVWLAHGAGVIVLVILVSQQLLPPLTLAIFIVFCARAVWGLSDYRKPSPAKIIGFQELGYGLLMVLIVAIGYSVF